MTESARQATYRWVDPDGDVIATGVVPVNEDGSYTMPTGDLPAPILGVYELQVEVVPSELHVTPVDVIAPSG